MQAIQLLTISLFLLFLAACSGDAGEPSKLILPSANVAAGSGTSVETNVGSATVTWTEPRFYIDDSPLILEELSKYRIYISQDQTDMSSFIEIDALANPNSYTIDYETNLIPAKTTIYVAMTAINFQGIESNLSSPIVQFTTN